MKRLLPFVLLSGCMVGPKYHKPEMAMPDQFLESPAKNAIALDDHDLIDWWKQLNDPFLDQLIEETCYSNFDLRITLEQVLQARAEYQAETAKLFPDIKLDAAAVRTRQSLNIFNSPAATAAAAGGDFSPVQNFFQVGFDAIWELDFFGKLRHSKRAAHYTWQSTEATARDIFITVVSEVANNYIAICKNQQLVRLAEENIAIDEEQLTLALSRYDAGLADESAVLDARASLDADEAALYELESTLKQAIYRLAVLLGKEPESVVAKFEKERPIPVAMGKVPPGLPSELLRRRPDIRSAERQIAAATEQIGVAVADLFPRVYLTATNLFAANPSGSNYGYGSSKLHKLFKPKSLTWSIGPGFSLPFLDFGRRSSVVRAQKAIQRQTIIAYEKTVITALEEVESALVGYAKQEERLASLLDQTEAVKRAYELALARYEAGLTDYQQFLLSWKTLIGSEKALAENEQALTSQFIAIYKALGGDWECSNLP
ncbi:MAG: efflux transporter outer membrane subunit [Parachlamydiales bacterium]